VTSPSAVAERDLVARFWDRLKVFGTRRLGDPSLAEDLAQEALRRVTEALRAGRVENLDALPAFVFQTATHLCMHEYRSRGREARAMARLQSGDVDPPAAEPHPLDGMVRREARAAVQAALRRLAPGDRDLLHSLYYEQEESAAVAGRLGITTGALRVRKHRAVSRLAELLGDWRL